MAEGSELTNQPEGVALKPAAPRIDAEKRQRIGQALYNSLTTARSQRKELDDSLEVYNNLYEMRTAKRDWPWPNASNVFVALIPTLLDTTVARLAQLVFVPRLYVVKGTTPQSAQFQHEVERFYNTEAWRHNWIEQQYQWVHLSCRDGFAALEVLWKRHERTMKVLKEVPVIDEASQTPVISPETGQPVTKFEPQEITIREYDDVWFEAVELPDPVKIPAVAPSLYFATAVGPRLFL